MKSPGKLSWLTEANKSAWYAQITDRNGPKKVYRKYKLRFLKIRKSCHYKLWHNFIWQSFNIDFVLYKIDNYLHKMSGSKVVA
jgi:hypothetical protein